MLKWFVGKDVAASASDDRKLIDRRPSRSRNREDIRWILDENVDIHLIRKF